MKAIYEEKRKGEKGNYEKIVVATTNNNKVNRLKNY